MNQSLDLRRLKIFLQYIVKLKAKIIICNPAFDCVFNPQYEIKKNVLNQSVLELKKKQQQNLPSDIMKPVTNSTINQTKC